MFGNRYLRSRSIKRSLLKFLWSNYFIRFTTFTSLNAHSGFTILIIIVNHSWIWSEYGIDDCSLYLVWMNFWRKYETFFFSTIWEYIGMTWRSIRMTRKGIGDDRNKSEYCTIFLAIFTISLARTDTCRLRFIFFF